MSIPTYGWDKIVDVLILIILEVLYEYCKRKYKGHKKRVLILIILEVLYEYGYKWIDSYCYCLNPYYTGSTL